MRLAEHYGIPHLSTGDLFRAQASRGTAFGLEAKRYMDAGELVPDDIVIGVVEECLAPGGPLDDGFVLDGFPRTLPQAVRARPSARRAAARRRRSTSKCPREIVLDRIAGRRVCKDCQHVYHVNMPPKVPWICDTCGEPGRAARRRHRGGRQPPPRDLRAATPSRSSTSTGRRQDASGSSTASATGDEVFASARRRDRRPRFRRLVSGTRASRARGHCARRREQIAHMRPRGCASSPRCTRRASRGRSPARRPPTSTARRATCSSGAAPARTSSATTGSRRWRACRRTR